MPVALDPIGPIGDLVLAIDDFGEFLTDVLTGADVFAADPQNVVLTVPDFAEAFASADLFGDLSWVDGIDLALQAIEDILRGEVLASSCPSSGTD